MSFTDRLRRERVIAIVRGSDPKAAERTVHTLREEGVGLIEVSLTTPDAADVIARCVREAGGALIGAGTVLTADDARAVQQAGAAFVVTPALAEGSVTAHALGLPVVAGALTPTEVVRAVAEGATAVKLFPASVGGPAYLRSLREPLPHVPFVPTGGVDAETARAYLEAGALAVGVGSPIVGDAPHGGDLDALRTRCRAFLAAVAGHREGA
ncbi:bifunctional 4-hydroxy-2-oxoglutarate aldolase/2-dehydro-3-deoxy-phosphogluconate aldolase [Streptomyces sp. DvalAA-19]|uniref:bifunctional 4-hydroxy-2-oxoglutarate aldolase/2-dehydro-3-deoxy-phosphogluconate aldolase n=1 Tax=Streptomyces sp. DvalAA-19 TaxID=1839761 RepID=UPI00081B6751|nr:bifunctional 4-hydroxy-2-oxoglutarate aldolase/2-dehydro-3-deoxy-phosphogluconate aldolase [Streptomyces sp. DvalAA-19]SCD59669.1 2-keto-3-deoxy-phosphogluconate aldolase [Streptomyces sp. DvalAA-19]